MTEIDACVVERLAEWLASSWHGDVTLHFGDKGIEYLRETRQTFINSFGHDHALWGQIEYGRVSALVREGKQYMIEEERTIKKSKL